MHVFRRFFEDFQQRIGGGQIEGLGRLQHDDPPSITVGGQLGKVDHVADGFDLDLCQPARAFVILAVFRCQIAVVGVVTGGKPATGFALAAGSVVSQRLLAQQRLRQKTGKAVLADALRTGQQQGTGQAFKAVRQLVPVGLLPGQQLHARLLTSNWSSS